MKEGRMYGCAFLMDGATVKRMLHLTVLALTGPIPPIVIFIEECTSECVYNYMLVYSR